MVRSAVACLLLAGLGWPGQGAAQSIVGTVTEGDTGRPVTGAMVRLLAGAGPTGVRFLTAADGSYRLSVPAAGTYWLRVERIGFSGSRLGPVQVGAGETVRRDLRVATAPVRLQGLDVSAARRRCSLGDGEGDETQVVWDEARKALAAATWTEREVGLRFHLDRTVRRLDPRGRTVTDETRQEMRVVGGNSVRSLPPGDLVDGGYVREDGGFVYYYGPDAEVLLSDPFLDTHCFRLVDGPEDEPHLLGLAFEPVPDRDTTDIEGVLLLDRATARLERVEFRYTGLGSALGRDQARGFVRFLELADGRWVVREWAIRAPILVLERSVGAGGRLVERPGVGAVQEFGASIRTVDGPDGVSWSADRPLGGLRGTVWDSIRGGPLPGAEVRLAGGGWRTTTGARGTWTLERVPPGTYRVTFGHPALDSLGIEAGFTDAVVEGDGVTRVELAVPPLDRILARQCPDPLAGSVVGFVLDPLGRPVPSVEVTSSQDGADGPRTVTDESGGFLLCGLRPDGEVTVSAVVGPIASEPRTVRPVSELAVRADLRVDVPTAVRDAPRAPARIPPRLSGTVVDLSNDRPVQGAMVEVLDADGELVIGRLTDAEGAFRVLPGPSGDYGLRVERLGYAPVEGARISVGEEGTAVEIRMAPEALAVEGVVVEVPGRVRRLELAGFYDRQAQGSGLLLDRRALDGMNLRETGDIVHRVPGLATLPQQTRGSMESTRRFLMFRRAARGSSACMPAIFMDGSRIREGGDWKQAMPSLDEIIPADEVEALELYEGPASTPARFSSMGGACGVIVIWSRSPLSARRGVR